jgi:hypothetical protein
VKTDDKREALEEILEKMDEIVDLIKAIDDDHLTAYCLAAFEGKDGGWLGHFERDVVQETLDELDEDDDDEDAS